GPALVVGVVEQPREAPALLVGGPVPVPVGGGAHDELDGAGVAAEGVRLRPLADLLPGRLAIQGHGPVLRGGFLRQKGNMRGVISTAAVPMRTFIGTPMRRK